MLEKISRVVDRYNEIEVQMADPEVLADYSRLNELAQERADIADLVEAYHKYNALTEELDETRQMRETAEETDMIRLIDDEIQRLEAELERLEERMRKLLVPKDPRDDKNVFIEVRAGAGGDEAGIFAADLMRLYMRYAERYSWKTEIVDENSTGVGGYKEVILAVKGKGAFSRFKYESGVHRVQRVPVTESQGRIHTSTVTVAVMPEVEEREITLDERDLEITSTFASGPGGQHMQKNATAARIIHKPSGIVVKVQSERSLTQNKRLGMAIIQARLEEIEQEKYNSAQAAERKSQVGTGERSEKIRTYNYPQNRVTDHRIGLNNYNLVAVMEGDLDEFVDALTLADQAEKLAMAGQ